MMNGAEMFEPDNEADLSELLSARREAVSVRGGGTRGIAGQGAPLRFAGSGITLYEPGALTLVAQAGTPVAEIEAALAAEGQRLAFEVPDMRGLLGTSGESTIGGVFAANASGPRRIAGGAARDYLLGVRFVDGAGRVVKNGGRVMKNVTGYDLVKLMAGSHGTLGVLTEVSLKVLPTPETDLTLACEGLSDSRAVAALSAALGSPFEVTGAAHQAGRTLIRIEGFADSVAYRAGRLRAHLKESGAFEPVDFDWRDLRDVAALQGRDGDLWRLALKPSQAAEVVAATGGEAVYDWSGGRVWLVVPEGTEVRAHVDEGHATCLRGAARAFTPEPPALAALTDGLRRKFDPKGILNPGLMA